MFTDIIERLKRGETVFLVTTYHQFCDLTAQSAHQAFSNFLSLLEAHKARFKWITEGWRYTQTIYTLTLIVTTHINTHRQTDNCYTYECKKVCLSYALVPLITDIHILGTNNNEPNHGGAQADAAGASMKNALWAWTLKYSQPIQQARCAKCEHS